MGSNTLNTALDTFVKSGGPQNLGRSIQQRRLLEQQQAQQSQIQNLLGTVTGINPLEPSPVQPNPAITGGVTIPDALPAELGGQGIQPPVPLSAESSAQQPASDVDQALTFARARQQQENEVRNRAVRVADAAIKLSFLGEQGQQVARFLLENQDALVQRPAFDALSEVKAIVTDAQNTLVLSGEDAALDQIIDSGRILTPESKALLNNMINPNDIESSIRNASSLLNQGKFAEIERKSALELRQIREKGEIDQRRKETPQELSVQDRLDIQKTQLQISQIQQKIDEDRGKSENAKVKEKQKVNRLISGIDNVIGRIDTAIGQSEGFAATGLGGAITSTIPTTPAANLERTIETIRANVGFDRLQQMRDLSPTGGALGQVAVQELNALQNSIANLDPTQPQEIVQENLKLVKESYENWKLTLQGINPREEVSLPQGVTEEDIQETLRQNPGLTRESLLNQLGSQ